MQFVYKNTTYGLEDTPIGEGTFAKVYGVKGHTHIVKLYKKNVYDEEVFENEKQVLISVKEMEGFATIITGKSLYFNR